VINDLAFNGGHFSILSFTVFIGIVFIVNIIPVSIIILGHYIYILKKEIKVTNQINRSITEKDVNENSSGTITISAINNKENITLKLSDLLYIASADNYIDVYYLEQGLVKHNLLRNTLNNIEEQTSGSYPDIKRCHKSYIVNTSLVKSVFGNASGYKIELKGAKFPIPVSRKYKDDLFKHLKS
jgi:DNA-binding LytR/AlgR family response regulator